MQRPGPWPAKGKILSDTPATKTQEQTGRYGVGVFEVNADNKSYMADIVRLAAVALEKGNVREAEAYLRQGLERVPEHPQCLAYLSVCVAARAGQTDKAEKLAKTIIRDNPRDPTAFFALGMVYLKTNQRRQAFHYFGRARQLAENDPYLLAQLDRAEPRRPPVLGFLPRNSRINILLGWLRYRLGR